MKIASLFLALVLLAGAVAVEQQRGGESIERPFVRLIAKIVHQPLPSVTGVKMPLSHAQLSPQDVALVFRAMVSFHPREIILLEPLGDFSVGPFSLVREAIEQREIEGVPVRFLTLPSEPQHRTALTPQVDLINLEDLLLWREESERGSILPELDLLFSGRRVLLGGDQIAVQAALLVDRAEKELLLPPSLRIEIPLLLLLLLALNKICSSSWIDFLLLLLGSIVLYISIDAWMLKSRGVLWPCIVPCSLLGVALLWKILSCTQSRRR
jgi:hypothetical protein